MVLGVLGVPGAAVDEGMTMLATAPVTGVATGVAAMIQGAWMSPLRWACQGGLPPR